MGKRSPRLQFTKEERAASELKKVIQKADIKADKLEKAEAKIPKKTVKRKERVVDAEGKVTTRLYLRKWIKRSQPPSSLMRQRRLRSILLYRQLTGKSGSLRKIMWA